MDLCGQQTFQNIQGEQMPTHFFLNLNSTLKSNLPYLFEIFTF